VGARSVGIIRWRTKAPEFYLTCKLIWPHLIIFSFQTKIKFSPWLNSNARKLRGTVQIKFHSFQLVSGQMCVQGLRGKTHRINTIIKSNMKISLLYRMYEHYPFRHCYLVHGPPCSLHWYTNRFSWGFSQKIKQCFLSGGESGNERWNLIVKSRPRSRRKRQNFTPPSKPSRKSRSLF
jgi:hypothetical protein